MHLLNSRLISCVPSEIVQLLLGIQLAAELAV